MSKVKVSYRIMAVRERETLVNDLLDKLGQVDKAAFYDEEHKGSMWNAVRIWSSYKDLPEGTTHLCFLADDADIVNQFTEAVEKCVENFPNAIWTFANRPQVNGKERAAHTPYVKIWNCWTRGIACLMPVKLIEGWLAFYREHLSHRTGWTRDDTTTALYALFNDIDVMMPIPNLVFGKDVKSVIKGHTRLNKNRDRSCWYGYDIDLSEFDTNEFVVTKSRAYFEFHLPQGDPLLELAKKKIDRKRKLEKVING